MALVSLITLPIGFLCIKGMSRNYAERFSQLVYADRKMNTTVIEYINGIEVIKAFNQSANSYTKYKDAVNYAANYAINWMRDCQLFKSLEFSIWPAVLTKVLPFGCYFNMHGTLSTPVFCTIIILSLGIVEPILTAIGFTDSVAQIGTIVSEVCEVLDAPELVRPTVNKTLKNLTINLKDVTFSYDNIKENEIIKDINMIIKPGSVTLGGIDIRDIPQKQLMEQIAYVSQDNYLFNYTVRENIRMGKPSTTDEEVENAAKVSGCHDFIMKLENGYDFIVGDAGGHLSGGERQRIAIARAMLKNAPIVIFDEATAYTDPESEAVIQESVAKLVSGKTLIVIAHRLSTITDSDKIIVVNNGNIVAEGTHEQLLLKCELYENMWKAHIGAKDEM